MTTRLTLMVILGLYGCADTASDLAGDKPQANPDDAVLDLGKADRVTDHWTTIAGHLPADGFVEAAIDYPEWFHGYTMALRAEQVIDLDILADARGYVRVYGPAHAEADGQPLFDRALWGGTTLRHDSAHARRLRLRVAEDGVYMVLYGPIWVWRADYTIASTCLENCLPDDACHGDAECAADEFCGPTGAACITAPCDIAYDVCQPKGGVNDHCFRAEMCGGGLPCINNRCSDFGGNLPMCHTDADCADSFCGCEDPQCSSRVCKAFSAEGDSCGGHVTANHVTHCGADLSCVGPWQAWDLPGNCGVVATVEQLLEDPERYDGRFVVVERGHINPGVAGCTRIACPVDDPCCNGCHSTEALYANKGDAEAGLAGIALTSDGEPYRCSGNSCDMYADCSAPPGLYGVGGWFSYTGTNEGTLEVVRRHSAF